jgi:hypothetical protein
MATSPDFLCLASNATRALADTVLDNLPDAVLVADARRSAGSAEGIETTLASLPDAAAPNARVLMWRFAHGEQPALTDITPLASTTDQRLVMPTFAPPVCEFETTDDEGGVHYFENCAVLVRDAGISTGISISMRDITERKRLEQEILEVSRRGLTCAPRALAERSRGLYGLKVNFCADVCPEFALTETNASHVYRIGQEDVFAAHCR